MKAKPNELFEDFTGSTGNITAAHSAGHLVVRNKVAPTYTDTEYQRVVRQNFTRFAKNWQDLTDAQRSLWAEKAKIVFSSSSYYGISGKISGFNLYVRCNMNLELIGINTPLTTPVDNMTGLFPNFKAVNLSATELKIVLEKNVEENDILVVRITRCLSAKAPTLTDSGRWERSLVEPPRLSSPKNTPPNLEHLLPVTKYRYKSMQSTPLAVTHPPVKPPSQT